MSDDLGYVVDMLLAGRRIVQSAEGLNKDDFLANPDKVDATLRRLEIIGEAANRVSEEFRELHPEVDWGGMVGLRNVLIHQYRKVDLDLIWGNLQREIPKLVDALESLVADKES